MWAAHGVRGAAARRDLRHRPPRSVLGQVRGAGRGQGGWRWGIADPARVGLIGHSWGGYETAYIITQTRRFAAAVAGAPVVNMISAYNGHPLVHGQAAAVPVRTHPESDRRFALGVPGAVRGELPGLSPGKSDHARAHPVRRQRRRRALVPGHRVHAGHAADWARRLCSCSTRTRDTVCARKRTRPTTTTGCWRGSTTSSGTRSRRSGS